MAIPTEVSVEFLQSAVIDEKSGKGGVPTIVVPASGTLGSDGACPRQGCNEGLRYTNSGGERVGH